MSILRLVRNFALLAVLALAAHMAAAANKSGGENSHHCGGQCSTSADCKGGCACVDIGFLFCVPKSH